ncbi:Superfamily II DNA/RNA helicases, SNF2 family [Enterobacter asburiae]|uniref:Superfamily II DNA/RNA helicases, SNF2 family n=1 Tax=Enterobacter asburiae TaxID=61645 RepID=A0A376EVI6_ENTAS|nr:Superfamily II DNA/RNA helicases, SNF2 family [Enterobacter asburiae]
MTSSKIFTPRPYQDLIINHEIDILRCNIWAGMGMGKTVATLTTLEDLFMAGAENTARAGAGTAARSRQHMAG